MSSMKTLSNQQVTHEDHTEARLTASPPSRGRQILRFLQHFGEMVLAMLLGMGLLMVVTSVIRIPMRAEVAALVMAVAMTLPMVAWMRIRKHAWRLNIEMAAAMIIPTIVLIAVSALGLLPRASLMLAIHVPMLPAMLVVMLYRWRDYTCH